MGHSRPNWAVGVIPLYPRSRPLGRTSRFGSFVPNPEVGTLFDHRVGAQQECFRDSNADSFRGLEIDGEIELRRLFNRNILRLLTLQDSVHERSAVSEGGGPICSE